MAISYVVAYKTDYGIKYFKVPDAITLNNADNYVFKNHNHVKLYRCINIMYHPEIIVETMH